MRIIEPMRHIVLPGLLAIRANFNRYKNYFLMTILHNIGSFLWKIFKSIFVREKDCCK